MEKFSKEYLYENYDIRKLQLGEIVKSFDCSELCYGALQNW